MMRAWMLALALGLVLPRFLPELPPASALVTLGALGLVCVLRARLRPLALLCFGLLWSCMQMQHASDERLAEALDGRTFWLEGRVIGLPDSRGDVVRFDLAEIQSRHAGLPPRLRLAWYGGPSLHAGERWRLAARLKRPHGLLNPQSFDQEAWMLARHIGATGTVKAGELLQPASGVGGWRDRLRSELLSIDAAGRQGAIAALVVGDGSGLSPSDWRVLQDTGTVHLMVISGQHVAMLAGLLYALVALLARSGFWPQRLPWLPCACAAALGGALGYGWLAGFEVPVQRACAMVAVVLLWRLRFRQLGVWLPLLMAFDGVLLLDPLASLQPGFWLSFAAVGLLALVFSGRLGSWPRRQTLPRAQWAMTLGLLPLMLALGLPISASGPLANLLAVPWVGLTVPVALLGTLLLPLHGIGEMLLVLAGGSLDLLFQLLSSIAAWQPAWLAAELPLWAWASVTVGALTLLLPAGTPVRALGIALMLPLLYPPTQAPSAGDADIWVFDVGQGLSVLVRTAGHALLYDAGPRHREFDSAERLIFPSLRKLGVDRLDLLLVSHADSDHAGGADSVMRLLRPRQVLSGEPTQLPAALQAQPCAAGQTWQWDGVRFGLWRWAAAIDGNQSSCVLMVEARGERMLLTGDIDARTEQALLQSNWPVQAHWLLLPHHGSNSSSSMPFITAVQPSAALISRGRHNNFGHPHAAVIRRLEALGVRLHDTADVGALKVRLGSFVEVQALREQRRVWREK